MRKYLRSLVGDRDFYKRLTAILIPLVIDNLVSNLVNIADNVMVGRMGLAEMTGVSVANQLTSILFITTFGAMSAVTIFGSQFAGKDDIEGVRSCFRLKLFFGLAVILAATCAMYFAGDRMIRLYLLGEGEAEEIEASFRAAQQYLKILLIGLVPYVMTQCLNSSLREMEQTKIPMRANVFGMMLNMCLNYILIFGKFGAPRLGVAGAAIATVISRYVSCLYVLLWILTHPGRQTAFFKNVFRPFRVPGSLLKDVLKRGAPLFANEFLYSIGNTAVIQAVSMRSLLAMSSLNIAMTFVRLFYVTGSAMSVALGIMVGMRLGAGEEDKAVEEARQCSAFTFLLSSVLALLFLTVVGVIPRFYNVGEDVRHMATQFMIVAAISLPGLALTHTSYGTLRSGGRTYLTMIYDNGGLWLLQWLPTFLTVELTEWSAVTAFAFSRGGFWVKALIGIVLVRSRCWVRNIVGGGKTEAEEETAPAATG